MSMRISVKLFLCLFSSLGCCPGNELKIARVFSDHGVLQRGVEVPVWGTAKAGSKVTIEFAGQSLSTVSSEDGEWLVELAPLKAQVVGNGMTVTSGEERLEIHDLLVGEVWYASGQSNM